MQAATHTIDWNAGLVASAKATHACHDHWEADSGRQLLANFCHMGNPLHLAILAHDLPVHEALGRLEAFAECQQLVEVRPVALQHADDEPIAVGLSRLKEESEDKRRIGCLCRCIGSQQEGTLAVVTQTTKSAEKAIRHAHSVQSNSSSGSLNTMQQWLPLNKQHAYAVQLLYQDTIGHQAWCGQTQPSLELPWPAQKLAIPACSWLDTAWLQ